MRSEARVLVGGILALAALALFVALRLRVTTDITHFLPGGESNAELSIARELATGEPSRTMVLLIEPERTGAGTPAGSPVDDSAGDPVSAAREAGRALEAALREDPRVGPALAFLEGGPPTGLEEALWRTYQPHLLAFFAENADAVREATSTTGLRDAVVALKHKLALPLSSFVSRAAPHDPTLVLPRLIERLAGGRGEGLVVREGRFMTQEGEAVLFLGTRASSSESSVQRPLLAGIRDAFARVAAASTVPLHLSFSGANRFAVHAEDSLRTDIRRVSIGSTVGLVLLFVVLFRSLRLVLLVLPVVSAGFLAGTAACLAAFGAVHGLTLAFGSALIGVSVDYAVHFHGHQLLAPAPEGPRRTLAALWPGLALSAATTVVGFLALMFSEFPGLRELSLFASVGITVALLATRTFLPALVGNPLPTRASAWLATRLDGLWSPRVRPWLLVPLAAAVVVAGVGLPRLRWNDGIAQLSRLDPALRAEDDHVRSRVARFDGRRLVVAWGTDEEAALEANDRVARVLEEARAEGLLGGCRSLATLLPSAARQREIVAAVQAADPWPRLAAALETEGFVPGLFEPFRETLAAPAPPPLTLADLMGSPLEPLVRPFRVPTSGGIGFMNLMRDVHDEEAVHARLAEVPGARWIDLETVFSSAYGAYRQQMAGLFSLGLVAVLLLVAVRHRALRPTLAACLPALLAGAGTLGVLSLAGVELNLLALVALLMVIGMGVDYGILLAETGGDSRLRRATQLSVFVAGATTILGFGLLALSDEPVLFLIGATAGLGVLTSLLLVPSIAILTAARRKS